jgi:S-adenosylmethionine hydrolase
MPPTITFLSDYGQADDFVGTCHGVMARILPEARILDITHGIARHDARRGALVLRNTLPYFPAGVHLAVVDPEVGRDRRALALRTAEDDRLLVGPDNGLLSLAAERFGGVLEAADIGRSPWRLEPVSATFHGRDIFAPVAARLAAGDPCDPDDLIAIELPSPRRDGDALVAHALAIDRFGNVQLDVTHEDLAGSGLRLGRPCELQVGAQRFTAWYAVTFADVRPGEILVYEDAYRTLAVAVNRGNAAALLGLEPDSELRIAAA